MRTLSSRLEVSDELWDRVKIYKIQHKYKTLNEAVVELIKRGLDG